MCLMLWIIKKEEQVFVESADERYFLAGPVGEEHLVYSSKFSQISLILCFLSQFGNAIIYS